MQHDNFSIADFPSLAAYRSDRPGKLRVLIATEEILGPVRNGGIASTYYHLARGLAAQGHEVSVLYLKGRTVENKTPEHWIDFYAGFGIDLVYLPKLDEQISGASPKWQWRWLSFYRWLKASDRFDIVHTSEWRGGAFYCLQAKRLGLAFADTLFAVKTSSPYIWNRHYQMRPIPKADLMAASYAEQKCVEWADIVIGGSAHLLSFMDHIGYTLPEGRTYVQPNIVDFAEVKVVDRRPERNFGETVTSRELVFFGRIEPRKGLELFVYALDALVARGVTPERVIFLGKEGEKMPGRGEMRPLEFIAEHAKNWPFEIECVTDLDQPEALSSMCRRDMIAVMPSLIENSTMAVYEALVHKIPFVATAVGGTPELIDPRDHRATLVSPDVVSLANRLEEILKGGQRVAQPAFDNDRNLAIWYGFHRYLAEHGHGEIAPTGIEAPEACALAAIHTPDDFSAAENALARFEGNSEIAECVLAISFVLKSGERERLNASASGKVHLLDMVGASQGELFNAALEKIRADCVVFVAGGCEIGDTAASTIIRSLTARPDALVTALVRHRSGKDGAETIAVPLGGDMASHALTGLAYGSDLFAGRLETFENIGPFAHYRMAAGIADEFIGRAVSDGHELFVIPETLVTNARAAGNSGESDPNRQYLIRKPLLEDVSLPVRKLLLYEGSGDRNRSSGAGIVSQAHRPEDGVAWLANVENMGQPEDSLPPRHRILLGMESKANALLFCAPHRGTLTIAIDGDVVREERDFGSDSDLVTGTLELLPLLEERSQIRIRIEIATDKKRRAASIAAQRLEQGIYFVTSHCPIFWDADFAAAMKKIQQSDRPAEPEPAKIVETGFVLALRDHLRK